MDAASGLQIAALVEAVVLKAQTAVVPARAHSGNNVDASISLIASDFAGALDQSATQTQVLSRGARRPRLAQASDRAVNVNLADREPR